MVSELKELSSSSSSSLGGSGSSSSGSGGSGSCSGSGSRVEPRPLDVLNLSFSALALMTLPRSPFDESPSSARFGRAGLETDDEGGASSISACTLGGLLGLMGFEGSISSFVDFAASSAFGGLSGFCDESVVDSPSSFGGFTGLRGPGREADADLGEVGA